MIYLDYHATTPVDPRVAEAVLQAMTAGFGNASSLDHALGDRAAAAVNTAARHVAALVGASPRDVIFTSGATESLNLAIQGTVQHLERSGIKPCIAKQRTKFDNTATVRDQNAILKSASGFLKILSPHLELTVMDFERDCLRPACRLRQAIRNSQYYLDDEFRQFGRDILVEAI